MCIKVSMYQDRVTRSRYIPVYKCQRHEKYSGVIDDHFIQVTMVRVKVYRCTADTAISLISLYRYTTIPLIPLISVYILILLQSNIFIKVLRGEA